MATHLLIFMPPKLVQEQLNKSKSNELVYMKGITICLTFLNNDCIDYVTICNVMKLITVVIL